MSKLRVSVACGLALVLLAACERSSAVATRTQGTDRRSLYEPGTTATTENSSEASTSYRAENKSDDPVRQINGKAIWSSS